MPLSKEQLALIASEQYFLGSSQIKGNTEKSERIST